MNGLKALAQRMILTPQTNFRPDRNFARQTILQTPLRFFSEGNPTSTLNNPKTVDSIIESSPVESEKSAPNPEPVRHTAPATHPVVARRRLLVKPKIIGKKLDLPNPQEIALLARVKYEKETDYLEKIVHVFKHMKHSLIQIKEDFKYCYNLRRTKKNTSNFSLAEYSRYSKNMVDLLKFVPYSFFVIVPFAELLLPFYIWLFPRSTPEQFLMKSKIGQMHADKENLQDAAQKYLFNQLKAVMEEDIKQLEEKVAAYQTNPLDTEALETIKELDRRIVDKFLANYEREYRKHLQIYTLGPKGYEMLLEFYFRDYLSGIYIVHRLLNAHIDLFNLFKKVVFRGQYPPTPFRQFKWDNPDIVWARNALLKFQLKSCFKKIDDSDQITFKNRGELRTLSSEDLYQMTRQRGLNIKSDEDRVKYIDLIWLQQLKGIDWDKRTWINVLRYHYCDILV